MEKKNFYIMKDGEFVERIKIDKRHEVAKRVVKFQKEKIEIKPYINSDDAVEILSIVLGNYYSKSKGKEDVETRLVSSTQIVYSYLLAVTKVMTNVETEEDGALNCLLDSGFEDCLRENIKNYQEILDSVYFTINQKNNYDREKDLEFFIDEAIYEMKSILDNGDKKISEQSKELVKSIDNLKNLQENGLPKKENKTKDKNNKIEEETNKKTKKEKTKK